MRILISGSSGFIGQPLHLSLKEQGHSVTRLVRTQKESSLDTVYWNPEGGVWDEKSFEGFDTVIHLAGENIVGRWSKRKKKKIYESRVHATRMLVQYLLKLKERPKIFISASAQGFYGDRGDEVLTEASPPGKGFISNVCIDWEEAGQPLHMRGVRVVNLRFSMVCDPSGGALQQMARIFKLGLGGNIGTGKQFISWISRNDLILSVHHILSHEEITGPVNICSPETVRQKDFAKTLAKVLQRPCFFVIPSWVIKIVMGELGEVLLLSSSNMNPEKLIETGFAFQNLNLEEMFQQFFSK